MAGKEQWENMPLDEMLMHLKERFRLHDQTGKELERVERLHGQYTNDVGDLVCLVSGVAPEQFGKVAICEGSSVHVVYVNCSINRPDRSGMRARGRPIYDISVETVKLVGGGK